MDLINKGLTSWGGVMGRLGVGDGATAAGLVLLKEARFCLGGDSHPQMRNQVWLKLIMGSHFSLLVF